MSDTALPVIFRFDTEANRLAFVPDPGIPQQLYIWAESDNVPDVYIWDEPNSQWEIINAVLPSGINQLTGDVTAGPGSGSQAATIANDAVTYAKMQDVTATARVLGRRTAGSGIVEECTLSQILDFLGSAARGDILYRGAANWTYLTPGSAGQFLQTQGPGADPIWASGGGGGGGTYEQITTISDAQYRTLNATPVTIVPAPGANKINIVIRWSVTAVVNTNFSGNTSLSLQYAGGGTAGMPAGSTSNYSTTGNKCLVSASGAANATVGASGINAAIEAVNAGAITGGATANGFRFSVVYTTVDVL